MKKLYFILAVLVFFLPATAASAAESQYVLQVDGLACPFCQYNIEKNVSKIDGILGVKANLKDGVVTIGQLHNKIMGLSSLSGINDLLKTRSRFPIGNVFPNGTSK